MHRKKNAMMTTAIYLILVIIMIITETVSFVVPSCTVMPAFATPATATVATVMSTRQSHHHPSSWLLLKLGMGGGGGGDDDEIDRELEKARQLLKQAKEQLAAMDRGEAFSPVLEEEDDMENSSSSTTTDALPFFASRNGPATKAGLNKRDIVLKSRNKDGLITVNGDKMAKLSEGEKWESRPLGEVFENELEDDEDVYSIATRQLGAQDVAASIYNLRKSMKTEDYMKIFDKKNYFIGEDV